jgi:hypothetical protein
MKGFCGKGKSGKLQYTVQEFCFSTFSTHRKTPLSIQTRVNMMEQVLNTLTPQLPPILSRQKSFGILSSTDIKY